MTNEKKVKILKILAIISAVFGTVFLILSFLEIGTRSLAIGLAFNCIGMMCNIRSCAITRKNQE